MRETGRNLLVIAAMKEEESAIQAVLSGYSRSGGTIGRRISLPCFTYKISDSRISVIRSGMGPVNAGLAVALFAEQEPLDGILLLGVGGAIAENLKIGDLVISKRVIQHDSFSSLDFGDARMRPGHAVFTENDRDEHVHSYSSDLGVLPSGAAGRLLAGAHYGTILSGNEFVGTSARKHAIAKLDPEALLVEMEAAGVAQIADRLGLPFLVTKTVADRLYPDGTIEQDFNSCLRAAAANAAQIVFEAIS